MCTDMQITNIKRELPMLLHAALGDKLHQVLLYGSYARGDYNAQSDVDIMVIADLPQDELRQYRKAVNRIASRTGLENDVLISIAMVDRDTIYSKRKILPFYNAVLTEGEVLYAGG